jgi:hypothetical protein
MDQRTPTTPATPEPGRTRDDRPRYEKPRITKRRSVVRATGQHFSGTGPLAGGLPANG